MSAKRIRIVGGPADGRDYAHNGERIFKLYHAPRGEAPSVHPIDIDPVAMDVCQGAFTVYTLRRIMFGGTIPLEFYAPTDMNDREAVMHMLARWKP